MAETPDLDQPGNAAQRGERFSLKSFMLQALLWLPLSFFVWFLWAGLFVAPVGLLTEALLTGLWPDQFHAVLRAGYGLEVEVFFELPEHMRRLGQGRSIAAIPINPMIYGYGLPLLAGLVISTPATARARLLQLIVGYVAVVGVQSWGAVWETFLTLHFQLGAEGAITMEAIGIGANATALAYQFGYLIFPGVVPSALWILMNRRFIEGIVILVPARRVGGAETPRPDDGQLDSESKAPGGGE